MPDHENDIDDAALAAELLELRAIGRRIGSEAVAWETPPTDLWDRIAAEAGDGHPATESLVRPESTSSDAPVIPLGQRRRGQWLLAAAAAVVLVVVGVLAVANWPGDDTTETLLASSELDPLDLAPEGAAGRAELVDLDGRMSLRLNVEGLVEDDGFLEVWIIDTEVSQLISLGPIRDDNTYALPTGVDPQAFPIVDVSIEPLDGDPTHSGQSVLRGQLAF